MKRCNRSWIVAFGTLFAMSVFVSVAAHAEELRDRAPRPGEFNPAHKTVELFEAIDDGLIQVKVIPKDDTEARVFITNATAEPLNVEMPDAFGLVPTLAQCCCGGCCGGCGGGAQSGGGGLGGGFFNVPAEEMRDMKTPIVCLQHGKRDPRPAIPYKFVPIESVTDSREMPVILALLAKGRVNQAAAQAAAWHLANEMSWQALSAKEIRHLNGTREPYFRANQLREAVAVTNYAKKQVDDKDGATSESTAPLGETTVDRE